MLLVGSAALGDYVEGVSDLDVVVVVPGSVEDPEAFAAPLRHSELTCPARRLELVVYRAEQAAAPTRDVVFELELGTGQGGDRLVTEPGEEAARRSVVDLAIARERGRSLAGPPPRELIGEPPRDDVLDALATGIRWSIAAEPESPNTVLNACRAVHFALEGGWVGKAEAASWGMQSGPDPDLARRALAARTPYPSADEWPAYEIGDRVVLFAEEAIAAVEGAAHQRFDRLTD